MATRNESLNDEGRRHQNIREDLDRKHLKGQISDDEYLKALADEDQRQRRLQGGISNPTGIDYSPPPPPPVNANVTVSASAPVQPSIIPQGTLEGLWLTTGNPPGINEDRDSA